MAMAEPHKEESIKNNGRKKILVLASTFPRWNNDTTPPFVFELEKRLAKEFDIIVLAPHYVGAKKNEIMESITVRRFQYFWPATFQKLCYEGGILPNLKKNKLLYVEAITLLIFEFITAAKIVKKEKIDLVHAHWIIPQGLIAVLLYKVFGVPYLVTTHGGDIFGLQSGLFQRIKKLVLENAKTITVVSNAIKDEIHKKINKNLPVEVISMGVDSKLFNPDKYDEKLKKKYNVTGPLLLFVGRLAEKKGVRYLIEAMPKIIQAFPKVILLIVGGGTMSDELKVLSKKLNVDDRIIFVGPVPNNELSKYYATSDLFIGPSIQTKEGDTEGLGLTFVEAAFSGSVPIGTKIGGIADVIVDKKTGLLVPQKDSKSLTNAVIELLKDKKLMNQLKTNARKNLVDTYDWKIVSQKYSQIYSL
jgi:glycosyltransferase involved in cell wall biosynthesis